MERKEFVENWNNTNLNQKKFTEYRQNAPFLYCHRKKVLVINNDHSLFQS